MEAQEKEISSGPKIRSERSCLVETSEEKVRSKQKFFSEGKYGLEKKEKEAVP